MRPLDFGIASYGNPFALSQTLDAIKAHSQSDWRCLIVSNVHPNLDIHAQTLEMIDAAVKTDPRFVAQFREDNIGYTGAVNEIFKWAETPYVGYIDNDATILTPGWDEKLAALFDQYHELGMVFPNGGPFPIQQAGYLEILWGVGYCWLTKTSLALSIGGFDTHIGHQEEVDFQTRVRLAGWKIACNPEVKVNHAATASNSPEASERINRGVVNWVDKWNRYFCGADMNYHSPNVLRHEDWHPSALYFERYWNRVIPGLNANPEILTHEGVEYDLIKVPRIKNLYRHRII